MDESLKSFIVGLITGAVAVFLILLLIVVANTTPCPKCKQDCSDSSIYCHKCGQQLRIIK